MTEGRRSIMWLCTRRTVSYSASPGWMIGPRSRERNCSSCMAAIAILPLSCRFLLWVVGRVHVEEIERALEIDLHDGRRARPRKVMHVGRQHHVTAGFARLGLLAIEFVAHASVE